MTTERQINETADLILDLPNLMRQERDRRRLSLRQMAAESGLTVRVVDRTMKCGLPTTQKSGLPTAQHAVDLLRWVAVSKKQLKSS